MAAMGAKQSSRCQEGSNARRLRSPSGKEHPLGSAAGCVWSATFLWL